MIDLLRELPREEIAAVRCPDCPGSTAPSSSLDVMCGENGHPLKASPGFLGVPYFWVLNGARTLAAVTALAIAFNVPWAPYAFGTILYCAFFGMLLRGSHPASLRWFLAGSLSMSALVALPAFADLGSHEGVVVLALVLGTAVVLALGSLAFVWVHTVEPSWYLKGFTLSAWFLALYSFAVLAAAGGGAVAGFAPPAIAWQAGLWLLGGNAGALTVIGLVRMGDLPSRAVGPVIRFRAAMRDPARPARITAGGSRPGFWGRVLDDFESIGVYFLNAANFVIYRVKWSAVRGANAATNQLIGLLDSALRWLLRMWDRTVRTARMLLRTLRHTCSRLVAVLAEFARVGPSFIALSAGSFLLLSKLSRAIVEYANADESTVMGLKFGFDSSVWPLAVIMAGLLVGIFTLGCLAVGTLVRMGLPAAALRAGGGGLQRYWSDSYYMFLVLAYSTWLSGLFVAGSPYGFGPLMTVASALLVASLLHYALKRPFESAVSPGASPQEQVP